ncbi:MAG: acyloxyacyl hydrolase [Rhodospirillales bacterium]|nr:acyloxyacyl hydrolase [Rhodospirillales bacterium]
MRVLKITLFVLCLLAVPLGARADELLHEMKIGVLHHDQDNLWSNASRESGIDGNIELIFNADIPLWTGNVRPALGASLNATGGTSKLYGAARWEIAIGENGLFTLGVGGAVHNGETALVSNNKKALGSKVLFYFPIEAGYRINERDTVSLFFDHVSNAWLAAPNEGMDTLGIRYGIRF